MIPAGFAAYTRIPHPLAGTLEPEQLTALVALLGVSECWCGVWDGYGYESDAPRLALPERPLLLYHGSPLALGDQSPTYWWPDDRAWIVASEIDFEYTCVGGSRELIASIERG